jgi:uncharacterized protein YjbI with pentapeptide repeats
MSKAQFSGSDFNDVNFSFADLSFAVLSGCDLTLASFRAQI